MGVCKDNDENIHSKCPINFNAMKHPEIGDGLKSDYKCKMAIGSSCIGRVYVYDGACTT